MFYNIIVFFTVLVLYFKNFFVKYDSPLHREHRSVREKRWIFIDTILQMCILPFYKYYLYHKSNTELL